MVSVLARLTDFALKPFLRLLGGRVATQELWQHLHRSALAGMNIGGGSDLNDSGELWALRHAARALDGVRPLTVFDVGANIGGYASAVLRELKGRVHLCCFEPSKAAFSKLAEAVSGFENVQLFNIGLSNADGPVLLHADAPCSGLASFYHRRLDHIGISMPMSEEVETRTLDGFCAEHAIESIDFLKLDVEGHELKVLEGAGGLIAKDAIGFIQFEFGGCNIDSRTFFQDLFYLLNPRFRVYRILKHGLAPIDHYRETLEQFVTTNFLAINRNAVAHALPLTGTRKP